MKNVLALLVPTRTSIGILGQSCLFAVSSVTRQLIQRYRRKQPARIDAVLCSAFHADIHAQRLFDVREIDAIAFHRRIVNM